MDIIPKKHCIHNFAKLSKIVVLFLYNIRAIIEPGIGIHTYLDFCFDMHIVCKAESCLI